MTFLTLLLGSGGLGAWVRSRGQNKTDLYDQVNKSQAELNEDERALRAFIQQELVRREDSYNKAIGGAEQRANNLTGMYDELSNKYREMTADYTMLHNRYMSQAHHIQNVTAISLDRDYWKRQALYYQGQITAMEDRIKDLEGTVGFLRSKVAS